MTDKKLEITRRVKNSYKYEIYSVFYRRSKNPY